MRYTLVRCRSQGYSRYVSVSVYSAALRGAATMQAVSQCADRLTARDLWNGAPDEDLRIRDRGAVCQREFGEHTTIFDIRERSHVLV